MKKFHPVAGGAVVGRPGTRPASSTLGRAVSALQLQAFNACTMISQDDLDPLVPLMPKAVDLAWAVGAERTLALHLAVAMPDAEAFLREHGAKIACYRLDPRDDGTLMLGFFNEADAKQVIENGGPSSLA